jgi:hypothetical protein
MPEKPAGPHKRDRLAARVQPPWAHKAFYYVWLAFISVGVGATVAGAEEARIPQLVVGTGFLALAAGTVGIDLLAVRRLRRDSPAWTPWVPPTDSPRLIFGRFLPAGRADQSYIKTLRDWQQSRS